MNKENEIVFIESGATDSYAKIPYILKKNGYKTTLIVITSSNLNTNFIKNSYNKIITFNFKFFSTQLKSLPPAVAYFIKSIVPISKTLIKIINLKPCIVMARSTPNWLCYLSKIWFKKSLFIYYPYDIRSFVYKDLEEVKKYKIPHFEIKAERYCFERADGILHKGDEKELSYLNERILGKNLKLKCPQLYFLPYLLKDLSVPITKNKLSKKDKKIHMVYVGHIASQRDWLESIQAIADQRIYIHLYGKTANLNEIEDKERTKEYYEKIISNKYIKIHTTVNQEQLAKEISKYDCGIFSFSKLEEIFEAISTGNKIFSYLEAGLPILCLKNFKAVNKIITDNKIGFAIDLNNKSELKKKLTLKNINRLYKYIPSAREELSMEHQLPRLLEFFKEVEIYHKQKNRR